MAPLPVKAILPGSQQAAVMELPLDDTDVSIDAMYRSMFHRQPLVNGYRGIAALPDPVAGAVARRYVSDLARRRPLVILINDRLEHASSFKQMIENVPGIERHGASGACTTYLSRAQPTPREPPMGEPLALECSRRRARNARVRRRRIALLWASRSRCGGATRISGRASRSKPRRTATWKESWLGWTGAMAVEGTLEDPAHAPIRILLTAVRARYVRVYPASAWMRDGTTIRGE